MAARPFFLWCHTRGVSLGFCSVFDQKRPPGATTWKMFPSIHLYFNLYFKVSPQKRPSACLYSFTLRFTLRTPKFPSSRLHSFTLRTFKTPKCLFALVPIPKTKIITLSDVLWVMSVKINFLSLSPKHDSTVACLQARSLRFSNSNRGVPEGATGICSQVPESP